MPTAKQHHDRLPPALLFYLARGVLPARDDRGGTTGLVEAFNLKYAESAAARAAVLRTLWALHADQSRAATPAGTDPWILKALRSPDDADGKKKPGGGSLDSTTTGESHDRARDVQDQELDQLERESSG